MEPEYRLLIEALGAKRDVKELLVFAEKLEGAGNLHAAATALDCAFGINPSDAGVQQSRQRVLNQLSVTEHDIVFRYIPAGSFLMGSADGDADERPVRSVHLEHYWMAETPVSWAAFCRLLDWKPPPEGMPRDFDPRSRKGPDWPGWRHFHGTKIRLQYCEDETQRAQDWHAHALGQTWKTGATGNTMTSQQLFGEPSRRDPTKAWAYESKPMVCVSREDAEKLCSHLSPAVGVRKRAGLIASLWSGKSSGESSPPPIQYRLPTEAEWEKAARGGLISCRYPWGSELPTKDICDFNRFDSFSIFPMKSFPPNNYGLYAMSGCVWEWTADWYDAEAYLADHAKSPQGPAKGSQRVVRGGSWADCAEAVTVSFRMSMDEEEPPHASNPNVGLRLCRSQSGRAD